MTAVLFLLRAVILVLLWGLVLAAVVAVRHDVFGTAKAKAAPVRRTPAPARAEKPKARGSKSGPRRLVVTEGALAGTTVPLSGSPITIGRADDSTLVLTDDYVSTHHARLLPQGETWVLEDLGSTNGTFLDRAKVTRPTPVPLGVPIRVGKTVLELRR
jgi:hypothetical protein